MHLGKNILLLLFFCIISYACIPTLNAQGQIETTRLPDNYNENTFGFKVKSDGFGFDYRFSQRVTHRLRYFYEAEYNILRHSKEVKVINPYFDVFSLRRFVFGKTHNVHNLKVGAGFDRMIFEKRDKNSISIHLFGSIGGSLAISKPIYYEIVDSVQTINNSYIPYTSYRKVDVHMQNNPTDILSRAPFKYGLDEIKFHPGIYLKFGVAYDFSTEPLKTNVLETGICLDYYFVPFEIMAGKSHSSIISIYIAYRFGTKYDANIHRDARRWERKQNSN